MDSARERGKLLLDFLSEERQICMVGNRVRGGTWDLRLAGTQGLRQWWGQQDCLDSGSVLLLVCVCVHICAHTKEDFGESVFYFHHVIPRAQTHAVQ